MATKKTDDAATDTTTDVVVHTRFGDDELRALRTPEDAMRLITETYGGYIDISEELGNGFSLLEDKDKARLVGRPLIIIQWQFSAGTFGEFVSASVMLMDTGDRVILNDGSTGICEQLRKLTDRLNRQAGLHVPRGLRASTYATCKTCNLPRLSTATVCTCGDDSAERAVGTTYYLETAAA